MASHIYIRVSMLCHSISIRLARNEKECVRETKCEHWSQVNVCDELCL